MRRRQRLPIRPATSALATTGNARVRMAVSVVVFAVAFSALQITRSTRQSATWDEPMHLTAGYLALTARDFRVDPSHPPFVRAWAAIPLAVFGFPVDATVIDRTPVRQWLSSGYGFARGFVSGADIDWMLLSGRAMVLVWGVVLGLLIAAWAFEWKGWPAGLAALVLVTLSPNIAAHTALITTDGALTTLVFGAVYFLWRFSRQPHWWNLVALSMCTALAVVTKFSAIVLAPVLAVLLALAVARKAVSLRQAAALVGAIALLTAVTIWTAYGFRYAPSSNPTWLLTQDTTGGTAGLPGLAPLLNWLDARRLLPNAFAQGLVFSLGSAQQLPAFLAGEVRAGGWWYYFPVAVTLKTPLALLALFVAGVVFSLRRWAADAMTPAFVLVPIVVWLGAATAAGVNLGVRHVLPVYPFMILIAAVAATELSRHRRAGRLLVVAAVATLALELGRSEPYPLSFFNTAAGGPENGFRYLADSNLGWGGNLKALKAWMDEQAVDRINLAYFGSVDPATYGIRAAYLPSSATFLLDRAGRPQLPGYVAISATALGGVYLPPWWRHFYAGFQDSEPVAVVGNSMRIYWVERWPEHSDPSLDAESLRTLADGLLFGLRWPELALVHYDEYLRREPRNPAGWNGMSLALVQAGRLAEALDGFRRVLALSPLDPNVRRNIALLEQQTGRAPAVRE
jgi:hypothetical protein